MLGSKGKIAVSCVRPTQSKVAPRLKFVKQMPDLFRRYSLKSSDAQQFHKQSADPNAMKYVVCAEHVLSSLRGRSCLLTLELRLCSYPQVDWTDSAGPIGFPGSPAAHLE